MKYLIFGLLLSLGLQVAAQENAFEWEVDIKKAAEISLAEKKPLFLFYTGSDWCGACKKLQNEVFTQPQFQEWAKKNVILVELDYPRNKEPDPRYVETNRQMKEMFGITSYPSILFVTPAVNRYGVYYMKIGSMGYMAGGPEAWINAANQFIPSQK